MRRVVAVAALACVLVVLVCAPAAHGKAAPQNTPPQQQAEVDAGSGDAATPAARTAKSAKQRGLVKQRVSASTVLATHKEFASSTLKKRFKRPTLAYVTPWNNHGYDIAKLFAAKFTYVSPVWLQIRKGDDLKPKITGQHDIDKDWMASVRAVCDVLPGNCPLITPRIVWETGTFTYGLMNALITQIADVVLQREFDGVVMEIGASPQSPLLPWFKHLGKILHDYKSVPHLARLKVILVIPPPSMNDADPHSFSPAELAELAPYADHFSLMSYDYSSARGRPGPVSPLPWVKAVTEYLAPDPDSPMRSKILMGTPFYGYDGTTAVTGPGYLDLLARYSPRIEWDKPSAEHRFRYVKNGEHHVVYYPTLYSLNERLKLAEELGVGLSIWEIGQGLDIWYDLL